MMGTKKNFETAEHLYQQSVKSGSEENGRYLEELLESAAKLCSKSAKRLLRD